MEPSESRTDGLLAGLATQAVIYLPQINGCSVMAREAEGIRTLAHHGPIALALDALQLALGTGPSLAAVDGQVAVTVPRLAGERRWDPFPQRAAREAGAEFLLALPLPESGDLPAALTLYGTGDCAADRLHALAVPLAAHAGGVLRLAREAQQARSTVEDISRALDSRAVIDQAIGILMAQQRCGADEAFALLRRTSQNRNIKLRVLCQDIVAGVAGPPRRLAERSRRTPADSAD